MIQEEPTNQQLARFLVIYGKLIPGFENLELNETIIENGLLCNPAYRAGALRHHRQFQEQLGKLHEKMMAGELQCDHIRPNGKRCPNHNESGSYFCGLHKNN